MYISNRYIVITKLEEEKVDGFQAVKVEDNFIYKGKVKIMPDTDVYMGNELIKVGDTVIFAKYSPDTKEITESGEVMKFVKIEDILAKV